IFRDHFDLEQVEVVGLRLLVAAVIGAVIGLERQTEHKFAGMRTHMLVSLGAAVFTLTIMLAETASSSDLSRVIQGVVTGVGFLGAGTILKATESKQVLGLTTAASIWVTAGAGMAVGAGFLLPGLIAVALGWLILEPARLIERWAGRKASS